MIRFPVAVGITVGENGAMVEPRRFPVRLVSVLLALIVGLGLLRLTFRDRAPAPAEREPAATAQSVPPDALPALRQEPREAPPASESAAHLPPELPPPIPPRTVKQGVTPEHPSATGMVHLTVFARHGRVKAVFTRLTATIWRVDGREKHVIEDATGVPVEVGEFAIRDLPDGDYLIEFVSEEDGQVVRARRNFRVAGYTADLGDIQLKVSTGIRARIVDVAGRPIEQADVVVVRPEEDPEQARKLTPDKNGWVTFMDLEPDLVHQVVVLGLPTRLERSVRTPERALETVSAVFKSPLRVVPVTIAFFIDGEFTKMQEIEGLESDTKLKTLTVLDGIFTTYLLPGTYRFWTEKREGTLTVDNCECVRAKVHLYPKPDEQGQGENR